MDNPTASPIPAHARRMALSVIAVFLSLLAFQPLPATLAQVTPPAPAEANSGDYAQIDTLQQRERVEADGTRETTLTVGVLLRTSRVGFRTIRAGTPCGPSLGIRSSGKAVVSAAREGGWGIA